MPHFHARYQGAEAVFSVDGFCIEGSLGSRAHKLIEAWAIENKDEIRGAWQLATQGKELPWLTPLQ